MSLTSTARVKAALGIPAGITFSDIAIGYAVDEANDYVLRALGQSSLTTEVVTERPIIVGNFQSSLVLRRKPALSVAGLTNFGRAFTASQYRLDPKTSSIHLLDPGEVFSQVVEEVVVEYVAGWTIDTVPKELIRCATMIAASFHNHTPMAGKTSETFDGARVDVDAAPIPPGAQAILARYEDAIVQRVR